MLEPCVHSDCHRTLGAFSITEAAVGLLLTITVICTSVSASAQVNDADRSTQDDETRTLSLTREQVLGMARSIDLQLDLDVMDMCFTNQWLLIENIQSAIEEESLVIVDSSPHHNGPLNPALLVRLGAARIPEGGPCVGQLNVYVFIDYGIQIYGDHRYGDLIVDHFDFDHRPPRLVESLSNKILVWSNDADRIIFGRANLDEYVPASAVGIIEEYLRQVVDNRAISTE